MIRRLTRMQLETPMVDSFRPSSAGSLIVVLALGFVGAACPADTGEDTGEGEGEGEGEDGACISGCDGTTARLCEADFGLNAREEDCTELGPLATCAVISAAPTCALPNGAVCWNTAAGVRGFIAPCAGDNVRCAWNADNSATCNYVAEWPARDGTCDGALYWFSNGSAVINCSLSIRRHALRRSAAAAAFRRESGARSDSPCVPTARRLVLLPGFAPDVFAGGSARLS
jgi:hypothetical protein